MNISYFFPLESKLDCLALKLFGSIPKCKLMPSLKPNIDVKLLFLNIFLYMLQPAVPFETMGAMWTTQDSRHVQESTRNE